MQREWVAVFSTTEYNRAVLVCELLLANGVEANLMNQQDSAYPVFGEISVLVPAHHVILARNIIGNAQF